MTVGRKKHLGRDETLTPSVSTDRWFLALYNQDISVAVQLSGTWRHVVQRGCTCAAAGANHCILPQVKLGDTVAVHADDAGSPDGEWYCEVLELFQDSWVGRLLRDRALGRGRGGGALSNGFCPVLCSSYSSCSCLLRFAVVARD